MLREVSIDIPSSQYTYTKNDSIIELSVSVKILVAYKFSPISHFPTLIRLIKRSWCNARIALLSVFEKVYLKELTYKGTKMEEEDYGLD